MHVNPREAATDRTSTLRKVVYSGITVAGLLGLAEIVARRAEPPPEIKQKAPLTEGAMEPSDLLGWEAKPGESTAFGVPSKTWINRMRTRNPEPEPKEEGTLRIVTLGDSTVYGVLVGDEEVFSEVAARALTERTGRTVEAWNGGIPGYDSSQALALYRERLTNLDPDLVVIATLWSDAQERQGGLERRDDAGKKGGLDALASVRMLRAWIKPAEPVEIPWQVEPNLGQTRVAAARYRENLRALALEAKDDGAVPVYLILPSIPDLTGEGPDPPRPAFREIMREVAHEEGTVAVEAAAAFAGGQPSLMLDYVHPSAEGHARIGATLCEAVEPILRARP